MNMKKLAATAAISGAMGLTAIGIGAGTAQADDHGGWGCWGFPCDGFQGPPGQLKKLPGPLHDVPPGHWDDVPLWGWH
ncbi:MAG: hypothetical protein QOC76_339 [Mycobacterium sp.]|jgi:hypothetical protein|nr:hypothetical protein [Mycobacterium sp.]